ncbi:MAG TPA: hypothetical protein VFZ16_22335 [Hyphomicrobiaceae bacterium]|nr:hypothetical protein [Hyphomicrobiaceae bacterium]
MSKLVLVNYRISEAEEREARRKIALIRSMLERCARMQKELAALEPVAGEDWSEVLERYAKLVDASQWRDFVGEYNRLYDELPEVERRLTKDLADAKAKRLRLELTAATLLASAGGAAERKELEAISKGAGTLYGDKFQDARSRVETLVRQRLDSPLSARDTALTSDQLALAKDLLAASPVEGSRAPIHGGFSEPVQAPYDADPAGPGTPSDRVIQLSERLSEIDPALVPVDDLVARLLALPARSPGARGQDWGLLIDSIELEAQERLDTAKRKREIGAAVDDGAAWLTPFQSLSADSLRERLAAAAAAGDLAATRAAAAEAQAWAEAEGKRQDGMRIRDALLGELTQLGYEVNLQGEAWDEGSRITIQKPSEPNYDVQLSSAPGGAIQSKVRAYDHSGRSAGINRRDVEVQQGWCDDLARVNKLLAKRGFAAQIVHEDRPGAFAQAPLPARRDRTDAPGLGKPKSRKV